ncbi:DUF6290 family protein [Pediococcus acidilactici]|uniref:DUF6290 family protein n=1 Tax=Pediococcus acidilactici TaxID=1254 RepID=UPI00132BEE3B|nr:DUF6290 family protein [Pediococcus acidilactici]KAF0514416.1 antitoxin [Pediococcus acidilactici]
MASSKKTKSLRINANLADAINDYLAVTGESFNSFAQQALAEKVEDILDLQDYNNAIKEDDGTRYTMDEVAKELGIEREKQK